MLVCRIAIFCILQVYNYYDYFYYNRFKALSILSGTTRVSQYQKGKTNLDLLEQQKAMLFGMINSNNHSNTSSLDTS